MFIHLVSCLWALRTLWSFKEIGKINRLLLWKKTVRLHVALIGFADTPRSPEAIRRVMTAALLTAIYDYDTDWVRTPDPHTSLSFRLLERYVPDTTVQKIAKDLFLADWSNALSRDALERGGEALLFYARFIGAEWLRVYSDAEILLFGRRLQILDDLLDLRHDEAAGDSNCFRLPERAVYGRELEDFLENAFFRALEKKSFVYEYIGSVCLRKLARLDHAPALRREFIAVGRLSTNAYAALAVLVGFHHYDAAMSWLAGFTAAAFGLITAHIMMFNDWVDRWHDRKKGKTLVSDHESEFRKHLLAHAGVLLFLLSVIANFFDPWVAGFAAGVWVIGLLYSYTRQWFVVQNVIVALCSASPILCGAVHAGELTAPVGVVFLALATLIMMREILKDIEDAPIDGGYKKTLPVVNGHASAVMVVISLNFLLALCFVIYPHTWAWGVGALVLAPTQFLNALLLLQRERFPKCKRALDVVLAVIVVGAALT